MKPVCTTCWLVSCIPANYSAPSCLYNQKVGNTFFFHNRHVIPTFYMYTTATLSAFSLVTRHTDTWNHNFSLFMCPRGIKSLPDPRTRHFNRFLAPAISSFFCCFRPRITHFLSDGFGQPAGKTREKLSTSFALNSVVPSIVRIKQKEMMLPLLIHKKKYW